MGGSRDKEGNSWRCPRAVRKCPHGRTPEPGCSGSGWHALYTTSMNQQHIGLGPPHHPSCGPVRRANTKCSVPQAQPLLTPAAKSAQQHWSDPFWGPPRPTPSFCVPAPTGCPPLAVFLSPPSSPPTQRMGNQPSYPQVEESLLKRRTRTCTRKYQPACSFSHFGAPPSFSGGGRSYPI